MFYRALINSNLFIRLVFMILVSSLFLSGCAVTEQSKSTDSMQSDLALLKKQVSTLTQNQTIIAQKIGLAQPHLNVGESASLGDENAPVILVEFTDLRCPFCKRFNSETFPTLMDKYISTGKMRFIGKHLPITSLHPSAFIASQLLECSREQTSDAIGYEKAKTWIFSQKKGISNAELDSFSIAQNVDKTALEACMNGSDVTAKIREDMLMAKQLGLNSTPSFVIGLQKEGVVTDWKIIKGAKTIDQFSQAIDQFVTLAANKPNVE